MFLVVVVFGVHLREGDEVDDLIPCARGLWGFAVRGRLQQVGSLQRGESVCGFVRGFANSGADGIVKVTLDSW